MNAVKEENGDIYFFESGNFLQEKVKGDIEPLPLIRSRNWTSRVKVE